MSDLSLSSRPAAGDCESALDMLRRWPAWRAHGPRILTVLVCLGLIGAFCTDVLQERSTLPERTPIHVSELKFYRAIAGDVRRGESYYAVANRRLREANYPVASFVRWRLPTLSWVAAAMPGDACMRVVLTLLSLAAWLLAMWAYRGQTFLPDRCILGVTLAGVSVWPLVDNSQYTHELWAAYLISISASLVALGRYRLAPLPGILALTFRELALPYCLCAAGLEWWRGRRASGTIWLVGLAACAAFYGWHAQQIRQFVAADEWTQSDSVLPWLSFGGLEFVLRTARMNALLIFLPGSGAYVVLVLSMFGLAAMRGDAGWLLLVTVLTYVAAFLFVGQDFNGYWGVIYAPLLPVGLAHARAGLRGIGLWPARHFAP